MSAASPRPLALLGTAQRPAPSRAFASAVSVISLAMSESHADIAVTPGRQARQPSDEASRYLDADNDPCEDVGMKHEIRVAKHAPRWCQVSRRHQDRAGEANDDGDWRGPRMSLPCEPEHRDSTCAHDDRSLQHLGSEPTQRQSPATTP